MSTGRRGNGPERVLPLPSYDRSREYGPRRETICRLNRCKSRSDASRVSQKAGEVPAQCDVEDFLSCGLEALIRSIDRYDPEKGATLEQYAWTRIHGAVLDELRRHDWAPRSLRRDERAINTAREGFISAHERQPSREELAAKVGMSPIELTERLDQVVLAEVGSLNRIVRSDESATIERIDTLESPDEDCDPTLGAERREAKE